MEHTFNEWGFCTRCYVHKNNPNFKCGSKQYRISYIYESYEDQDDLGKGTGINRSESLKTGNAGKRIACAVIGYSKDNFC